MLVVLDTNVLYEDWWLERAAIRTLLAESQAKRLVVAVPEIVVREVANKYREAVSAAEKALSTVLPKDEIVELGTRAIRYEESLRGRLAEARVMIHPLPAVSHDKIVRRALRRAKPFNLAGAGYRDVLVWESVLELVKRRGDATLVSNDGDFADKNPFRLADVLADEAGRLGRSVALETSLKHFVDVNIATVQATLELLKHRLGEDAFRAALEAKVRHVVVDGYPSTEDIDAEEDGYELESVTVDNVVAIEAFDFGRTHPLDEERVVFDLDVIADVELQLQMRAPSSEEGQRWEQETWWTTQTVTLGLEGTALKANGDVLGVTWWSLHA